MQYMELQHYSWKYWFISVIFEKLLTESDCHKIFFIVDFICLIKVQDTKNLFCSKFCKLYKRMEAFLDYLKVPQIFVSQKRNWKELQSLGYFFISYFSDL